MKRLKLLREEYHLTQAELGEKTGYTQQTIANYENDRNTPSIKCLAIFADFFNTSVDYLLERTDMRRMPADDAPDQLSKEEVQLIKSFRSLKRDSRRMLYSNIAFLKESEGKYKV